jgi:hypothetical protein
MNPTPRELLDAAAGTRIPDDLNLYPRLLRCVRRIDNSPNNWRTFMQTLRAKPALMILFVLLALALLSGAAYAIGRSLGYIPGVGIVEQGAPIRVLAEPVSLTQDGITVIVTEAILTQETSMVSFVVENFPWDAVSRDERVYGCPGIAELILPDGNVLKPTAGGGATYQARFYYQPVPLHVKQVTFVLPCLNQTLPGLAPENWELILQFVPAPPDMAIFPIIEIETPTPLPQAQNKDNLAQSETFMGFSLHLDRFQFTGRGYLLKTSLRQLPELNTESYWAGQDMVLTDSVGQAIELNPINSWKYQYPFDPQRRLSGYAINNVPFNPPLTLTLSSVAVALPRDNRPQFTFDPGNNSQPGQEWQINQSIEVFGETVEILSVRHAAFQEVANEAWVQYMPANLRVFEIRLRASQEFRTVTLGVDSGYADDGSGSSGFPKERDENGILTAYALVSGEIIAPLVIGVEILEIQHEWQISFDPEQILAGTKPVSESDPLDATLIIEKVIPNEDGYYLVGRTQWDDPRFAGLGAWQKRLLASDGTEIPLEMISPHQIGIREASEEADLYRWYYRVYGKNLPATLILSSDTAHVSLTQPYMFTFDPGPNLRQGQEWVIDLSLNILGHPINIKKARYFLLYGSPALEFTIHTISPISHLRLDVGSGVKADDILGGGDSTSRDEAGNMTVIVTTFGQFTGEPIDLLIENLSLDVDWQTTWNPPAPEAGATPFYIPQACLTLDSVKQALANPPALPPGLTGKLLQMRGALAPDPTLFVTNLDGSGEIPLVFGYGTLSPDLRKLVYADPQNQIVVLDIASRQLTTLTRNQHDVSPKWSPDGAKIAFERTSSNGRHIFVMNADGSDTRQLTDQVTNINLMGWTGNSQSLLVQDGKKVELLNISDGSRRILLQMHRDSYGSPMAAISPDEKWLAYLDKIPGREASGLYISRLDGTEKRLLVQLEHWPVNVPIFSPDGQWLVFSTHNIDDTSPKDATPLILNIQTCQVFPLNGLQGEILQWLQP